MQFVYLWPNETLYHSSRASESLLHSYERSFNGFVAKLTEEEMKKISSKRITFEKWYLELQKKQSPFQSDEISMFRHGERSLCVPKRKEDAAHNEVMGFHGISSRSHESNGAGKRHYSGGAGHRDLAWIWKLACCLCSCCNCNRQVF